MPRKNLPPYVQRVTRNGRTRFRGWAILAGKRKWSKLRDTPQQAHDDAMTMRRVGAVPAWGGTFEGRTDEWLAAIAPRVAPDTLAFYRGQLAVVWRTIPKTIAVERITPPALAEFVRDATKAGLSARTVQHCRRVLHNWFVWCLKRGYVTQNPVPLIDWPRPRSKPIRVFTRDELAATLDRITDPWARDLVTFIAYTGLRKTEVARLRVEDVNVQERVLWLRGKVRDEAHPVAEDAAAALGRLVAAARGQWLIPCRPAGKESTLDRRRYRIAETFRTWQKRLKEPRLHAHNLRHSAATILIRDGIDRDHVQRLLRHSTGAMTQRYVHLVGEDVRATAGRLRLLGGKDEARHG